MAGAQPVPATLEKATVIGEASQAKFLCQDGHAA
jgi:hypothetical protein